MFRKIEVRLIVGWCLIFVGFLLAMFVYGFGEAPKPEDAYFQLTDIDRKKLPWEVFKYALFTVAIGAISVVYKYYLDAVEKSRIQRIEHAEDTRTLRAEIIEIYSGFKAVRREVRARAKFELGQPIEILCVDFFEQYSKFNALQHLVEALEWRLAMAQDFLGDDQSRVVELVKKIENFTGSVGEEARKFDTFSIGNIITIHPGSDLFEFFQKNISARRGIQSVVNKEFFAVTSELRKILHLRVRRLDEI